jgi:hypothetical protein
MANVFKGRVWTLATAGGGIIYTGQVKIAVAYWRNPSAGGDLVVLNDADGRPIIDGRAEAANQSQVFRVEPMWYRGLNLVTLGSGTLQLHIM